MEIIRTSCLSAAQLSAVSELADCCKLTDHSDFSYTAEDPFCHYLLFSDTGQLAACLSALYTSEPEELECLALTRPGMRKRGYFRRLLEALTQDCPETDIIFPVDHGIPASLSVMSALDADCISTNLQMELDLSIPDLSGAGADAPVLTGFILEEDPAGIWTLRTDITGISAGSCQLAYYESAACLHHVETNPDYRRQGCAAGMLRMLCPLLRKKGINRLFLHVLADNTAAVALYKKTGFRITKTLSYYLF